MESQPICSNCNSTVDATETYCPNCGFPENGDENEKKRFKYSIKLKKDALEEATKKTKNVKILLYVLTILNVGVGLFWLQTSETYWDAIGAFIIAIVFLACSFWIKKQPLIGIISAFVFWILIQLSVVFEDPFLLIQGFIWKIIIIGLFIKGINSAKDVKELRERLGNND